MNKKLAFSIVTLAMILMVSQVSAVNQMYMFPMDEQLTGAHYNRSLFLPGYSEYTDPSYSYFPDINHDGTVNIIDIADCSNRFGAECGDPDYCEKCDLILDCIIDIRDISLLSQHFGEASSWCARAHNASFCQWRTISAQQGRTMGGDQHQKFRIGFTESGSSQGDWIAIYPMYPLPENKYFVEAKVKIKDRTAYWDWLYPWCNSYQVPLLAMGLNFHWQYAEYDPWPYIVWSDFDNPNPYAGSRGIYNDIYFDFSLWKNFEWQHELGIGANWGDVAGRYDHDFHFCYVGGQVLTLNEWIVITVDVGKVWNEMMNYANYWWYWKDFFAFRLRGFELYLESSGASTVAQVEYIDFYLT